jgi:hypothetical protein
MSGIRPSSRPPTVVLSGPRHGQGTSSLAIALGLIAEADRRVLLVGHDPADVALPPGLAGPLADDGTFEVPAGLQLGWPFAEHGVAELVIIDAGSGPSGPLQPLGLRAVPQPLPSRRPRPSTAPPRTAGVIRLGQQGRSLKPAKASTPVPWRSPPPCR